MKKNWTEPMIEGIDISSTEYDSDTGVKVDGTYQNHEDCEYYTAYFS